MSPPANAEDPVGEEGTMPVPGIVHRYPDRVLFLVTDRRASYCRYCTRSRLVSNAQAYDFHPELEAGLKYIESHPEIRDVLLSGGDPLLLSDAETGRAPRPPACDQACRVHPSRLAHPGLPAAAHHVRAGRYLPQARTGLDEHPYQSSQGGHPRARRGLRYGFPAGVPLGNQSVLLAASTTSPRS
jgi:lysine 2,3-aminomutase